MLMAIKINGLQITNRVTIFIRKPQSFQTSVGIYHNYFMCHSSPKTAREFFANFGTITVRLFQYFMAPYCICRFTVCKL